jgi:hypothetical protein
MEHQNIGKKVEVKFWLDQNEARQLNEILAPVGGKRGPFAKALVLREIEARRFRKATDDRS